MKLILKKHRNALYELIRAAQHAPQLFLLTEQSTQQNEHLRVELSGTPLYFEITAKLSTETRLFQYAHSIFTIAYPDPVISRGTTNSWFYFSSIENEFTSWLSKDVRRYLNYMAEVEEERATPDLWSELGSSPSSNSDSLMLQNTPFHQQEQARISDALHEFTEEVKSRGILTPDQLNLLQEQVDYLVEASKRLGRKDWLAAAAGALIGFTLQAGLTTDTATQIIRLAGEAIQWIARNPLLLI